MSEPVYVAIICEGPTELNLVKSMLAPHLEQRGVYMTPILLTKKGQKGGGVKYNRLYNDLKTYLQQGHNHCVTTLLDFYGLEDHWPGYDEARKRQHPAGKQEILSREVKVTAENSLRDLGVQKRFLPYFAMHEIEALYFSSPETLAAKLGVAVSKVQAILAECGEPEAINHEKETSPSHRLHELSGGRFLKTTTGIAIAQAIGLPGMRRACPLFDKWMTALENLAKVPELS